MKYYESEIIELKEILTPEIKEEIVAFANTNGGIIYIGVSDSGEIKGVDNPSGIMESITSIIHDTIKPDLSMLTSVSIINYVDKEIVVVKVLKGTKKPYYLSEKGLKPNGVYVRHGIASVPSTEETIRQMIFEADAYSFEKDKTINTQLTFEYAKRYLENQALSFNESNMRTLGLINEDNDYTNLGLILSDQSPFVVKIAVYQNETTLEFKTRKEFSGSILKLVDDVLDYFTIINKMSSKIVGFTRVDNYDFPIYALREAFLNALVHRDYSFKGGIIINVYSNRIEIISLGGILSRLTLEDIQRGVSETRNINLANIFYRVGLIEAYGTGLRRINESYANFIKKPEIIATANTFTIVLYNTNENVGIVTDKQKILEYIRNNGSITRLEVEQLLGLKKSSALNILKELIEDNLIFLNDDTKRARYYLK